MLIERGILIVLIIFSLSIISAMPILTSKPVPLFGRAISSLSVGAFPTLALVGIIVFSLLTLFMDRRKSLYSDSSIAEKNARLSMVRHKHAPKFNLRALVLLFGCLLLAATILESFGYLVTMSLVTFVITWYLGNRRLPLVLVLSILPSMIIYYVVGSSLNVYLPVGSLTIDVLSR